MIKVAVLQMTSGIEPEANFAVIRDAAAKARSEGADVLFTPEMSILLDRDRARAGQHIVTQDKSPFVAELAQVARTQGLYIALGSMAVALPDGRWANRSMLFSPAGEAPGHYDKMHMFDVDLPGGENWRESNAYRPGDGVVVEELRIGEKAPSAETSRAVRLGLAICYDMRFPALFDVLGRKACDVIAIPAAFTVPTGKAHWEILLRARAIEASAYVVAAAQVGEHEDGRRTYGHSMVIGPWGDVILNLGGAGPGLGYAELDLTRLDEVRAQVPSLANRRDISP